MSAGLIIRADANTRMGTGHVMRCIALGQAWQDAGGEVVFVSCCDSTPIKQRILAEGFELIELAQAYPVAEDDLTRTTKVAEENGAIWIVTDGYHFDLEYQKVLRRTGFKLLCVDDYNHLLEYEADILLNQNVGAEEIDYRCNPECHKLLGTRYVMLRREFRTQETGTRELPSVGTRVLVTLGGADPYNITLTVIQNLQQLDIPNLHVKVLVGPANPHIESLRQVTTSVTLKCELISAVRNMPELMDWADFSISAAGSTCWELCRMGAPFGSIVVAENQKGVSAGLDRNKIAPSLGDMDLIDASRMRETVKGLLYNSSERQRMRDAGFRFVDGFGLDRILCYPAIDADMDLFGNRLILRRVRPDDAGQLFEWVNDLLTRRNSLHSNPISFDDHMDWFNKKLDTSDATLFILELDGVPCGHIRYELEELNDILLSFLVAPSFRGMGMGQKLIELSRNEVFSHWTGRRIKAVALIENLASSRILQKTGFVCESQEVFSGRECKVYYWSSANVHE